ncbi:unnamed protein product [Echinostoma caproni]|uniref:ABC1 domain-containing protein n=1 Tax=Echinostoma caproni TaxID=27848 RepID=A0A183AU32_9TREM|nr:unnamed protein product [Echinostoma caproni]
MLSACMMRGIRYESRTAAVEAFIELVDGVHHFDMAEIAIGTPLRLKQTYGEGLMVELKMTRDYRLMPDEADTEVQTSLRSFLRSLKTRFPQIQVVDQFEDRVSLRLPINTAEIFRVTFDVLLDAHRNRAIEDFTISSPTLEQVYFDLAKTQLQT